MIIERKCCATHTWPAGVNHQRADAIVLAWVAVADNGDVELAQVGARDGGWGQLGGDFRGG